jgi:hypothetical protein
LFSTLADSFGLRGRDISRMVVRRMYEKADIPFYEVAGTHMIQYVHELKRTLTMIEYSIKPNELLHH